MINVTNIKVVGFHDALRGMRNPKNSWERADSIVLDGFDPESIEIGRSDIHLAGSLVEGGPVHAKFRRMIVVYCDILAPLYWWKEFDTYKVGTVANSCSTMHKIHAKEFTRDDFSHEHLITREDDEFEECRITNKELGWKGVDPDDDYTSSDAIDLIIGLLNKYRKLYLDKKSKKYWWQMIQLLPSSYNQLRTVMFNYEVAANIYKNRKDHKLDEWHDFCDILMELPYGNELIAGNICHECMISGMPGA